MRQVNRIPEFMRKAMLAYCKTVIESRAPDVTIGTEADPYVKRWWLGPHGDKPSAYLHVFYRDDHDGALHDHRYQNTSVVLDVGYYEYFHVEPLRLLGDKFETECFLRLPGEVIQRPAALAHRIALIDGQPATTIFFTGEKERDWGFHLPTGWVHWKVFNAAFPERDNGNYKDSAT